MAGAITAAPAVDWWQVELLPDPTQLDAVESWCWAQGALSVTCIPAPDAEDVLEPDPGATPGWSATRLQLLFPADESMASLRVRLARNWCEAGMTGAQMQSSNWDVNGLTNEDWQSRWRQHVQTRCFANRLWVQTLDAPQPDADPSENGPSKNRPSENAVVVRLDPGLAFGTGSHPTTALCLEWLAANLVVGARVVDFGCGSGILAIAAAKLGASVVYALDHDPQALRATMDNATTNGVQGVVELIGKGELPDACCEVLCANILAGTLIDFAPEFTRLLVVDGDLVMSGVLAHQADRVRAAYPDFVFDSDEQAEDWVCIRGRRGSRTGA